MQEPKKSILNYVDNLDLLITKCYNAFLTNPISKSNNQVKNEKVTSKITELQNQSGFHGSFPAHLNP